MLDKLIIDVRSSIRINHTELDSEIKNLIDTAIDDLKTSGIASSYFDENNLRPMIKTAVITYCKANFGYDNPDAQRLHESYELQKQKLAITYHDYNEIKDDYNGIV